MRYAIISDIHSNLPALNSVVDELNKRKVDKTICLGDVVGYGANPNECCNLIREISSFTVLGNHDAGAIGLTPLSHFSWAAKEACIWTTQHLSPASAGWLKELPLSCKIPTPARHLADGEGGDHFLITHSSPSNPKSWKYISSLEDAIDEFFSWKSENVCFIGHSHIPVTFSVQNETRYNIILDPIFTLEPEHRYLINPGSVGQPRDGDPRASFGIFDNEAQQVEIIRVSYDIKSAQQRIIDAGLPEFLSSRLAQGR